MSGISTVSEKFALYPSSKQEICNGIDLSLDDLYLSGRSKNILKRHEIHLLSDILDSDLDDILSQSGVGSVISAEIRGLVAAVNDVLEANPEAKLMFQQKRELKAEKKRIIGLIADVKKDSKVCKCEAAVKLLDQLISSTMNSGSLSSLPQIKTAEDLYCMDVFISRFAPFIFGSFDHASFSGYTAEEFASFLPKSFGRKNLDKLLAYMVSEKMLFLSGLKYIPIFSSVFDVLDEVLSGQTAGIFLRLAEGTDRKQIGTEFGISSQQISNAKASALNRLRRSRRIFEEDKYRSLYEGYAIDPETFAEVFCESGRVYNYLKMRYSKGCEDFRKAKDDKTLPPAVRYPLVKHLDRKSINRAKPEKPAKANKKAPASGFCTIPAPTFRDVKKGHSEFKREAYLRLKKKIANQFDRKYYIGDIAINDIEYEMLKCYAAKRISQLIECKRPVEDDIILATALVQIGVRKYDGSYWPRLTEELDIRATELVQGYIGKSFIYTVKKHGKAFVHETDRVESILLHTFVSNYYSKGVFELLFQYFKTDLERDIHRNDGEQMKSLMETLATKAALDETSSEAFADTFMQKGSRAYKLKHHTLQAICSNPGHSSMRLRRIIRQIDTAFWKGAVPKNPTSRLTILFKQWADDSKAFQSEYRLYKSGGIVNRGKKHFSSPYLKVNISKTEFKIVLPAQIIREEQEKNIYWKISTAGSSSVCNVTTITALTGSKTVEASADICSNHLFDEILCELCSGSSVIRRFIVPKSSVRFFDEDGDYSSRLFKIPMIAYSVVGDELYSPALIENTITNGISRWYFEFEDGDVVILPNGDSLCVGEKYTNGLIPRGAVKNAEYCSEVGSLPLYKAIPSLMLTIPDKKIPGTIIDVNGTRHRLRV